MTRYPLVDGRVVHSRAYRTRRFWNWFPLGVAYALLYMGRYNLTVAQGELGGLMTKEAFGDIFGIGTLIYGCAFVVNGPLTDRIGGRAAMLISLAGAALANLGIGLYLRSAIRGGTATAASVETTLTALYGANMYFQSFGAVAIVKVNSSWFHVRERGGFSGIFGVMISSGIYFAFDLNDRLLLWLRPDEAAGAPNPTWIVFFAPAAALGAILLVELALLRDHPSGAGQEDIETGAHVHGDEEGEVGTLEILRRILTHPVILTVALIEFCTGVLRQGVMQWFKVYSKEQSGVADASEGWSFVNANWGLILFVAGVIGGNLAGLVSDKVFGSRRAPAAGLLYVFLTASVAAMAFVLRDAWTMAALGFVAQLAVIGTHGLLSGTATMDFGGRKGTATAVGVIDGFVYLGTGLQSLAIPRVIETGGWAWWPIFLVPFGVIGIALLLRIWRAMPQGRAAPA